MKKIIFISAVIILIGLVGYIFVIKKSANQEPPQPVSQNEIKVPSQPFPTTTFDTNDNLDQALQELDHINNF